VNRHINAVLVRNASSMHLMLKGTCLFIQVIFCSSYLSWLLAVVFSERERYMSSSVRLSAVCLSSVTFVHPTQAIEIFRNVFMPFGTLAICDPSTKILRRSSHWNPSVGGLNQRGVEKCSDFGPFQGYISETVRDRR